MNRRIPFARIATVACACSLLTSPTWAQSLYLDRGTSGVGVAAGYAVFEDVNQVGGTVGYSHNGVLDIATGVSRSTFDGVEGTSTLQLSPALTYYPLKQTKHVPASLAIGAGYRNARYQSDALDAAGSEMSMTGITIGAGVSKAFAVSRTGRLIPNASVSFFTGQLAVTDSGGERVTTDGDATTFSAGSSYATNVTPGSTLAVAGSFSVDDAGHTGVGLDLGLVFPLSRR